MREALRRSQERASVRLFPELKRRYRARDEPPLIGPQKIGKSGWNTARMLSMVFEVIQPDLEINRRHVATLLIPPDNQQCATHFGQFCGGILANSGSGRCRANAFPAAGPPGIRRVFIPHSDRRL